MINIFPNTSENVDKPAIAQLVEHLTVDSCSNQMLPGSIPGRRIFVFASEPHCDDDTNTEADIAGDTLVRL